MLLACQLLSINFRKSCLYKGLFLFYLVFRYRLSDNNLNGMNLQSSMDEQFLTQINNIINENIGNERFTVEELAESVGISRSMLHRKMKKITGKSASEYILEKRLDKSRELLENDIATAAEISYKTGFSSPSYFNKVFKSRFGVSPGEYKKVTNKSISYNHLNDINPKPQTKWKFKTFRFIIIMTIIVVSVLAFLLKQKTNQNTQTEKSIAVLPFDNFDTEKENQYFADGMVDDLLNRLSLIDDLKVISRTSSEMYREKGNKSITQIAKELGVSYIIEGSIQKNNEKIRVNVQLIDAINDDHVWAKLYEVDFTDVFKIQSEIALQVAAELNTILSDDQAMDIRKNPTNNTKAFEYYQIGKNLIEQRTRDDMLLSIEYYNRAIHLDSNFALAYAGLANSYYIAAWHQWIDVDSAKNEAKRLSYMAIEIDKKISDAHMVLGGVYQEIEYNLNAAENEYKQALKLNPNNTVALHYYAELLTITDRQQQARKLINKALSLNPYSFSLRNISSYFYWIQRDYDNLLEENKICLQLFKNRDWIIFRDFVTYVEMQKGEKALESMRKIAKITNQYSFAQIDSAYTLQGSIGLVYLDIQTTDSYWQKALDFNLLGNSEKTIEMLENAYKTNELHPLNLVY